MVRYGAGEFNFVLKQLIFAVMTLFIIWSISRLDSEVWMHKIGIGLFLIGFALMIAMNFLPASFVPEIGGASRWITIFGFSIAPVEFFKVGFIYFIAWSMSRKVEIDREHKFRTEFKIFFPYFFAYGIAVLFITVIQKDLGQSVVLGVALILLTYLAGSSGRFVLKIIGILLVAFVGLIVTFGHRVERIASWWEMAKGWLPEYVNRLIGHTTGEEPYQVQQALGAIHNGGFWGTGLGNGIFKYGFLSEVHTDFVLEGIAEEMGLFSIIVIFFLFMMLFQRILKVANRSQNRVYFLFNIGIALLIGATLLINTYGATALIPMKGIPVPFISYGGSSMFALAFAIGMVLMTSKEANREDQEKRLEEYETDPSSYMGANPQEHQQQQSYDDYHYEYQRRQAEYYEKYGYGGGDETNNYTENSSYGYHHHQDRDRREF
jgi:cell division protein FtsW